MSNHPFAFGGVVLLLMSIVLVGPLTAIGAVLYARRSYAKDRRSALSRHLLRPAGHSLAEMLQRLRDKLDMYLLELILVPLLLISYLLLSRHALGDGMTFTAILLGVVALAHLAWRVVGVVRLQRQVRQLRIGLDAEMATGQELDQLMRQGAAVFHDLPADYGNIDHVVICRAGVYAVETKGRSKLQGVKNGHEVTFDGQALIFPRWMETRPLSQAQQQAQWLSRWLSDAVGRKVAVTPVVMLPGWCIDRRGRSEVRVMNPREKHSLLSGDGRPLDDRLLHAVAHAVEERCRNVQPHSMKLLPIKSELAEALD